MTTNDAATGRGMIDFAREFMPALRAATDVARDRGVLAGTRVGVALALEPKTACLAEAIASLGAEVVVLGSPNSTKPPVAAALVAAGLEVIAEPGASRERMGELSDQFLRSRLDYIIDDGAQNIRRAHRECRAALDTLRGAAEDTTSGVRPLRVMDAEGSLEIPCVAVNDARTKLMGDNVYGTGQSVVTAVMDATGRSLDGRVVVVAGYGRVGRGIAVMAKAFGARVVVTEVDPVAALAAYHDGFAIARLDEVLPETAVVFTATGIGHTFTADHLVMLPEGAIVAVGGAGPPEFDPTLGSPVTIEPEAIPSVRPIDVGNGRRVFIVSEGYCANTSAGEGNPIEAMDLTFGLQMRALDYVAGTELPIGVHTLPAEIDDAVAASQLAALGLHIDTPSAAQRAAAQQW